MSRANGQNCRVSFISTGMTMAALLAAELTLAGAGCARAEDPPEANTNRPAILVLGDSLAAGLGVDPSEAYPALLQKKVDTAGLNFAVINGGVSGDTSAGGLRRINWYLRRKIDVLILELGGNDGLRGVPPGATRTNLQAIIDTAKKTWPDLKIVIAGMRLPPNLGREYTDAFEKIFPALERENRAALVPFLLEGVGGRPELNATDQMHPTAEGHQIVAENVWKILKPVLEAKP
jgi:acyl-CoA thioesterase-1